jgi:serine-type D-Ala-D-Ala carboxypeptidase (penicillin-binding protein 5/6)
MGAMIRPGPLLSFAAALLLGACATDPPASPGYSPVAAAPTQFHPGYGPPETVVPPQYAPAPALPGPSSLRTSAPPINADSYILIDPGNGRVLAARNADTPRSVASTQKILTALIVVEAGNLDKPVRIAASDVAVEPSKLGVRPGEVYTRRELVTAFLVKSANDVANALARDNAGSVAAFAAKMNARARSLGAYHSYFANPHGLSAGGQHSTARDMAQIATAVYHNGFIRDVVRRRYSTFRYANGRTVTLKNTNELLGRMAECDGMKTGYTEPAGRCLISTAHRGGREVLLVQLGTKTKYIWNDGAAMMGWGLGR